MFTDGIGQWRVIGRFQDLDAASLGNPRESHPKLAIVISDEILRPHTKSRGFAKLLGSPCVSGRACHTDVDHFARVQFDDEEGEERTGEKVSHEKKVAHPDLLGLSANERPPGLSMGSCGAHSSHVLLNGSFRNVNAQLEEFASDAFCSPQAVVPCHLLNQGHRLLRDPWLERSCSGLVLPEELEALAVPPQQRLWLDDEQRLFPGIYYSGQQDQEHAVPLGTCRSFHLATQDDHLLTQQCVFCHQFGLASGKVSQRRKQQRGGVRFYPGDEAEVERPKTKACQPRDEGKNPIHSVRYPFVKMSE